MKLTEQINEAKTLGDILNIIQSCKTIDDANEVIQAYEKINPYAKENIGYGLGYLGEKERNRLYDLFKDCNHPIFGSSFGRGKEISLKETFEAGKKSLE